MINLNGSNSHNLNSLVEQILVYAFLLVGGRFSSERILFSLKFILPSPSPLMLFLFYPLSSRIWTTQY